MNHGQFGSATPTRETDDRSSAEVGEHRLVQQTSCCSIALFSNATVTLKSLRPRDRLKPHVWREARWGTTLALEDLALFARDGAKINVASQPTRIAVK